VLVACGASADDSSVSVRGGLVSPMGEHPSVVMERCIVNADVYPDHSQVRCEFVFHNTGRAQTVAMGFPAFGVESQGRVEVKAPPLSDFRTWVDGREVRTQVRHQLGHSTGWGEGEPGIRWYVKWVWFGRDQRRVVQASYRQLNGDSTGGERSFPYTITSGASWLGPIGHLLVTVRWAEPWSWSEVSHRYWQFRPSADGSRLSWEGKAVEPQHDVSVRFTPGWRLRWHGQSSYAPMARVTGDQALIRGRDLAELAGGRQQDKKFDPATKTVVMSLPHHGSMRFQAGSRSAQVNGQAVTLPSAPEIDERTREMWIPLAPVVEPLGMTVTLDRENKRVEVTQPAG